MPRKTLAQSLSETRALSRTRSLANARVGRGKREAKIQRAPSAAQAAYASVMQTYTKRTAALIDRHVVGALPVLGSGDPLDVTALQRGLEALRVDLDALAHTIRRSAAAAFNRTNAHAAREAARVLGVKIPDDKRETELAREAFVNRQVRLLQRAGRAQVERIERAIATYPEGTSLRARIERQIWVMRDRSAMVARNEVFKMSEREVARWSRQAGSPGGIYHTKRDELVRPSHAEHDGRYYAWGEEPSTLGEPNCRCRMYPVTAATIT